MLACDLLSIKTQLTKRLGLIERISRQKLPSKQKKQAVTRMDTKFFEAKFALLIVAPFAPLFLDVFQFVLLGGHAP